LKICEHGPNLDWRKFYIHLRSLNVSNFQTVEAKGLKNVWRRSDLQWHGLPNDFHRNLTDLKISGEKHRRADGQTGRTNGDLLISFPFSGQKDNSISTSKKTQRISITKSDWEIIAVYLIIIRNK
jgi:hypothetical protein